MWNNREEDAQTESAKAAERRNANEYQKQLFKLDRQNTVAGEKRRDLFATPAAIAEHVC